MSASRYFDTVVFDVRDNANLLFFARTTATGDIEDYLLLMRTFETGFEDVVYVEINEEQLAGDETVREAALSNNLLTLTFDRDLPPDSEDAMICTFECTFCRDCVQHILDGRCPNCGGNLQPRPVRPAAHLARFPASTNRVRRERNG